MGAPVTAPACFSSFSPARQIGARRSATFVKRAFIIFGCIIALVCGVWLSRRGAKPMPDAHLDATNTLTTAAQVTKIPATAATHPGRLPSLLGETILRGYADTNLPPEHDLTLMSRLMDNSVLLLKSAANRPLSANEDWADLFRGKNSAHEVFLPERHAALNTQGQLVDRWNSPLFIHALGSGRYELRSAGPDKKLWTGDDLHRNADGSFRRGRELNSPSLLEATARPR